jgi:hypothetical protein
MREYIETYDFNWRDSETGIARQSLIQFSNGSATGDDRFRALMQGIKCQFDEYTWQGFLRFLLEGDESSEGPADPYVRQWLNEYEDELRRDFKLDWVPEKIKCPVCGSNLDLGYDGQPIGVTPPPDPAEAQDAKDLHEQIIEEIERQAKKDAQESVDDLPF